MLIQEDETLSSFVSSWLILKYVTNPHKTEQIKIFRGIIISGFHGQMFPQLQVTCLLTKENLFSMIKIFPFLSVKFCELHPRIAAQQNSVHVQNKQCKCLLLFGASHYLYQK